MTIRFLVLTALMVFVVGCSTPSANVQPAVTDQDKMMADQFMQTAQAFVQSAVGGDGNVQVIIQGDVATLIGYVGSVVTRKKAENAALRDSRIATVDNRIIVN